MILRFLIGYSSFSVRAILTLGQLAERKVELEKPVLSTIILKLSENILFI